MNISISVAATPCAMPQIMFAGDLEARCAFLAGIGYDGIDLFFPDPKGTDAHAVRSALDRCGLRATMLAAQGDLMADGLYLNDAGRLPELLERSKRHLEQCALLGAMPNIGFIRGWHRNSPESWRHRSAWTCSLSRFAVMKSTPSTPRIRPLISVSGREGPATSGCFSIFST